jgi:hypothetical protein
VSADIVNLRRARKAARRDKADAQAAENRIAFGAGAGERERLREQKRRGEKHLDQHRLPPSKS